MPHFRRGLSVALVAGLALTVPGHTGRALAARPADGPATYVVQPSDTLSGIAQRLGTSVAALMAANGITNPNLIIAGQVLTFGGTQAVAHSGGSASAAGQSATYAVQAGDTLSAIGVRYGVSVAALASENGIADSTILQIGRRLAIPAGGTIVPAADVAPVASSQAGGYTVRWGDTLSSIGQQYGVSVDALVAANGLADPAAIRTGQHLAIPGGGTAPAAAAVVPSAAIGDILTTQAQAAGLDPALVKALAWQESGWQMITAADGGLGVMQLMPDSVTWVSDSLLGYQIQPYDATDNVRAGVAMLRYYMQVFGDVRQALAAYHQGLVSVQTQGISPDTELYINNILALQLRFGTP